MLPSSHPLQIPYITLQVNYTGTDNAKETQSDSLGISHDEYEDCSEVIKSFNSHKNKM